MSEKLLESPSLPDINVWLAMVWESHSHHDKARKWFDDPRNQQPAILCRITQRGLLRLLGQRLIMSNAALTQRRAWQTCDELLKNPRITFADEPADLQAAFQRRSTRDEISPKRWTDDYLAAFAEVAKLSLVTFDRTLADRVQSSLLLTP